MNKIKLNLTEKELFLLAQVLEAHIKQLDIKTESANTSENEYSDIQNDFIVLKPLLNQFKEVLDNKYNDEI